MKGARIFFSENSSEIHMPSITVYVAKFWYDLSYQMPLFGFDSNFTFTILSIIKLKAGVVF